MSNPDLIAVPITLSVPKWMRDYIQETARLKASKIFQEAVLVKKKELDAQREERRHNERRKTTTRYSFLSTNS